VLIRLLDTSIGHDLCIYRQQEVAFWHGYVRIFLKQTKSQTLIRLYLFLKNWTNQNPKPEHPVFVTSSLGLNFLVSWSLDTLLPFFMLQIVLNIQILNSSSSIDHFLNLWKLDVPKYQIGLSGFFSQAKFGHQQRYLHPSRWEG
jgi:hypothetical protein